MLCRLSAGCGVPPRVLADQWLGDDLIGMEAFYSLEPWGGKPDDIRTASIVHAILSGLTTNPPKFQKCILKWDTAEPLDAKASNEALKRLAESQKPKRT